MRFTLSGDMHALHYGIMYSCNVVCSEDLATCDFKCCAFEAYSNCVDLFLLRLVVYAVCSRIG